MVERAEQDGQLTPVKRALLEIRELRARLESGESAKHEPIAIVGMGLRFPGHAIDETSFWQLLSEGRDAITEIPKNRWDIDAYFAEDPDEPGKMCTRYGGFLEDIDRFDPEFFNISPREAESMDPQQRLLLEVTWQALENASLSPERLAGTSAGIFLGINNSDYFRMLLGEQGRLDAYAASGNAFSVAAGRLSYFLGIHGPSIALDTACSSSLVAIHLACQSLHSRECSAALAGGVNLVLTPEISIGFSKARMLAPDGRCKTFDASANGYVRGEGCSIIVLKRLSDAVKDNDRILAVIRGSAVNQDGRSGGLTAPNGPAQEAVIRQALSAARVDAREVSYVEAHGTGTSLGDPIEVQALGAVLCEGRSNQEPLYIGSVKTNIGHLESAAGIAGLIKVVLSLQHREIPAHLHLKSKNPLIDWDRLPIAIPSERTPWVSSNNRRIAGVSSFGISGTNSHVILEQAPEPALEPMEVTENRPWHVTALSAKSEAALKELVGRYEAHLSSHPEESLGGVAYTANTGRMHFSHRIAVMARSTEELQASLAEYGRTGRGRELISGEIKDTRSPEIAFLFTGQGSQYQGMGKELYESSDVFRAAVDRCVSAVEGKLDRPLLEVMFGDGKTLGQTNYTQPALYALEWGLAELWKSWGIEPTAVLGHSVGEYVAAAVAGVVEVEEGMRWVAERGRLMQGLGSGGAMLAVKAGKERLRKAIEKHGSRVSIAAVNGPESVVVSGWEAQVEEVEKELRGEGIEVKRLAVSHGFHSIQMDSMLVEWERVVRNKELREPRIRLVTNVSGMVAEDGEVTGAAYWVKQVREAVAFEQGMKTLEELGIRQFVEIGPHPVLVGMGIESLPSDSMHWFPSLRRNSGGDWHSLLESVQGLYVTGVRINWSALPGKPRSRRLQLPTYPFQRRRYWIETSGSKRPGGHPKEGSPWDGVLEAAQRQSEQAPVDVNISNFPAKWKCLEQLTRAYALRTLKQLGAFAVPGRSYSVEDILSETGIRTIYRNLIFRWLESLCNEGLLKESDNRFTSDGALPTADIEGAWSRVEEIHRDDPAALAYTHNCGDKLANVLTGKESALETLFPQGSFALAEGLYERSVATRYTHGIAIAAVESIVHARQPDELLRMLEIGAGTGATTAALVPSLREKQPEYFFTDVSDFFLAHAAEKFEKYSFLKYGLFDAESPIDTDTYKEGSFDVILATNAVHATRNLGVSLPHISSLLAPGGILILIEVTRHQVWFDMTTGLIEGWQHFDDEWRSDQPLLHPETWKVALLRNGFEEARTFPESGSLADAVGQHVILARVPGSASRNQVARLDSQTNVANRSMQAAPGGGTQLLANGEPNQIFRDLQQVLPQEREDLLVAFVRDEVMRTLRIDPSYPPERHSRLMDLGLDSLMAVQLRNRLTKALQLEQPLPATLMFDHPTIEAIARFLESGVLKMKGSPEASAPQPIAEEHRDSPLRESEIQQMSDEDAEEMLMKRLSQK